MCPRQFFSQFASQEASIHRAQRHQDSLPPGRLGMNVVWHGGRRPPRVPVRILSTVTTLTANRGWTVYFRNQGGSLIARFRRESSDRIDIGCTAPVLSNASSLYTKECSPLPNVVVSSLGFRLVGAEASARAAAADSTTAAQKRSSGVDQERGGGKKMWPHHLDVANPGALSMSEIRRV